MTIKFKGVQKMSVLLKRSEIGQGIHFTAIRDSRFKTNRLSFNFILPLSKETASAYAILPFLFRKGYRGCSDYTELNQKLNRLYGANLYTDVLKSGDFQVLNLSISSIDDSFALEKEAVSKEAADILCRLIRQPAFLLDDFDLSQFDLEKQALVDAIEAEINEKTSYAVQRMVANMCAEEPYGIHRFGDVESVKRLTMQDIAQAYGRALKTAQIEIYSIGCGNADEVAQQIEEDFSALAERSPAASIDSKRVYRALSVQTVEESYSVNQAKLVMGFRVDAKTPEEMDQVRLMSLLYGGTPRSKLFMNVREKLSLCYYCSSRLDRTKGILYVNSGVEFANVQKAKDEILKQLEEVKAGHFTDEELQETKLMAADSFKTVNDSPSSMETWYLGQLFTHSEASPEEEAERLSQVTREQVMEAAAKITLDTVYLLKGEGEEA